MDVLAVVLLTLCTILGPFLALLGPLITILLVCLWLYFWGAGEWT